MPSPFNQFLVGNYGVAQFAQGVRIETVTVCEIDCWREPKLGFTICPSYMDMHRLSGAFIGLEEKTK